MCKTDLEFPIQKQYQTAQKSSQLNEVLAACQKLVKEQLALALTSSLILWAWLCISLSNSNYSQEKGAGAEHKQQRPSDSLSPMIRE